MDLEMITNALRRGPKTFTYLLHTTKLPRKTLSLRLKELCEGGIMIKDEEGYMLKGVTTMESRFGGALNRLSSIPTDKRVRAGILLALLIVSMPVAAQVLALLFQAPESPPQTPVTVTEPTVIGNFTMALVIQNVNGLYFWQVAIAFNPQQMKMLNVVPGVIPESTYPGMLSNAYYEKGLLIVGDFLLPPEGGWSGSGTLATITFGYYTNEYTLPSISSGSLFKTALLDSQLNSVAQGATLSLAIAPN
jgi:hypothetical protein